MTNKELETFFRKRSSFLRESFLFEMAREDYILRLEFMGLFETEYIIRGFEDLGIIHHDK